MPVLNDNTVLLIFLLYIFFTLNSFNMKLSFNMFQANSLIKRKTGTRQLDNITKDL